MLHFITLSALRRPARSLFPLSTIVKMVDLQPDAGIKWFFVRVRATPFSWIGYLMKTMCYVILATGSLMAAAGAGQGEPGQGDLDKLRGTWLPVSLVNDGKTLVDEKAPPKGGPATRLVMTGTRG